MEEGDLRDRLFWAGNVRKYGMGRKGKKRVMGMCDGDFGTWEGYLEKSELRYHERHKVYIDIYHRIRTKR